MTLDVRMYSDSEIQVALGVAICELGFGSRRDFHGRGSGGGYIGAVGAVEGQYRVALSADRGVDQSPERDQ